MPRWLAIACSCLALLGCVGARTDRLPTEIRFRNILETADMFGVFRNQGRSSTGEWQPVLSDFLFPGVSFGEPPTEVRLGAGEPLSLKCEALLRGNVLAVRDLVERRDFRLDEGAISFGRKLDESGILEGGVAVSTEACVIRLTEMGDAVLSCHRSAVGLMLFVVPMATSVSEEAVFAKLPDPGLAGSGS